MRLERFVLAKRDLDAGDFGILVNQVFDPGAIDFVAHAVRAKQNDAIPGAPILVLEVPNALAVERDNGVDPACAIEVRPLIGEPEMAFNDLAADSLEIDHAGIAIELLADPSTAIDFDLWPRLGMNCPVVEHASLERLARGVSPPNRFSTDHSGIRTQVLAA